MRIVILYNINRTNTYEEIDFDREHTIDALITALRPHHEVYPLECRRDILDWLQRLLEFQPDFIFNFAAGYPSVAREAFYPALYEQLGIPYFGSDPTTMIISHNKGLTNKIVEESGVNVPWFTALFSKAELEFLRRKSLSYPLIVKPNGEAWGIGVSRDSVVNDFDELESQVTRIWNQFNNIALVQRYIPLGIEVSMSYVEGLGTTGVFGPVVYEFDKGKMVFSYEVKSFPYSESILKYPDTITDDLKKRLHDDMKRAVKALDIRGYARADFRIDPDGVCYFIEMNARTEVMPVRSDFTGPIIRAGYTYEEIVLHMVEHAMSNPERRPSMVGLFTPDSIHSAIPS